MASNSFGQIFKVTTYGESHGKQIGLVIDGCPAGLCIDEAFIEAEMARRRPGQSDVTTPRKESDQVQITSGVYDGKTTGSPIHMFISNSDVRSQDYDQFKGAFRPSHADYTYELKYGHRDHRGGGRSSARETACRVAAGAIAKLLLKHYNINVAAYTSQIGHISMLELPKDLSRENIDSNMVRCPDSKTAAKMIALINDLKQDGDSIGGVVSCTLKNLPVGLGEPVYDKFEARLAQAMLSINASKGFDIGAGFNAAKMKGSAHNDKMEYKNEHFSFQSNHAGGVMGGITNGEDVYFRVAFKPTSTIGKITEILKNDGSKQLVTSSGRHDPCIVPRAVPVVEAMAACVCADFILMNSTSKL